MRAVIRRFHSPDLELDSEFSAGSQDIAILLQMIVGPAEGEGEESFDVMVCTPAWLSREVSSTGPLVGRHYLIVDRLNMKEVTEFLRREVESLAGATWRDLAEKIGRIGRWEFEDYQP